MSYETPVINWSEAREPAPSDFNRIEGNIEEIHDVQVPAESAARAAADTALSNRTAVLEGLGSIQGVGTDNGPTFNGGVITDNVSIKHRLYSGSTSSSGSILIAPLTIDTSKIIGAQLLWKSSTVSNIWESGSAPVEFDQLNNRISVTGLTPAILPYKLTVLYEA